MPARISESLSAPTVPTHAFFDSHSWVVVADREIASIYSLHNRKISLIRELHQPDLDIDGLDNIGIGRHASSAGAGFHSYDPSMDEMRQSEVALVRETIKFLEHELSQQKFKSLILVAGPQTLGEIRKCLTPSLKEAVTAEEAKNLTQFNGEDLQERLLKIIPGPEKE